jgi:hypothetical protein
VQQNGNQLHRTRLQAETEYGYRLPAHELVHTAQQVRSVAPATISRAELSTAGPVAEASGVELKEPAETSEA